MFRLVGSWIARRWRETIFLWVVTLVVLRPPWFMTEWLGYSGAPRWDDVVLDGDFAFLPADRPSVIGQRWLREGFPKNRSQSQIVIVVAAAEEFGNEEAAIANDISRRIRNLQGVELYRHAQRMSGKRPLRREDPQVQEIIDKATNAFETAIESEERISQIMGTDRLTEHSFPYPYYNLSVINAASGNDLDRDEDLEIALAMDPALPRKPESMLPTHASIPIVDVWDWRDHILKDKLVSEDGLAKLMIVQLANEFVAVDNIRVMDLIEAEIQNVRSAWPSAFRAGTIRLEVSGSAAVGTDMLRSARDSIRHTELVTIVLVLVILVVIYRSPLLVMLPLATIGVSLAVAMSLIAVLSSLGSLPAMGWWELKVFTTTKIFIVVILFGAGTDYCLFLIARYRELSSQGVDPELAVEETIAGVGDALLASALTTVLGLGMMYFAEFQKYTYSGPVIGICLLVTLTACLTLAPALLRMVGPRIFWPHTVASLSAAAPKDSGFWAWIAGQVIRRPGMVLLLGYVLLGPAAIYGWVHQSRVTYDLLDALSAERSSKIGAEVMRQHFPVGESGPITMLVSHPDARFDQPQQRGRIAELAKVVRESDPRIVTVRSIVDPLGDYPDGQMPMASINLAMLRARTGSIFVSSDPDRVGQITRLELITSLDPFSPESAELLDTVNSAVVRHASAQRGFWGKAEFAYTGITAAIRDLRVVTREDTVLIEFLVVVAVFLVLLVVLKRPVASLYLIFTVLFSFYVTLGISQYCFAWCYGPGYPGMDWKSPLFLFVILVAVGQDYNVYLVTRIIEEQRRRGPLAGIRFAIMQTGGIITSCGIIMAGTFFSMTSALWGYVLPDWISTFGILETSRGALRGMMELGFALALGILLDTFIVRTVLVPTFFVGLTRWFPRSGAQP